MKQFKIVNAYNAAGLLSECDISHTDQWQIYKLRKMLRPHFEFQNERENAVREKYSSFIDEKGMINGEKAQEFVKDINEIGELDIELEEYTKPKIQIAKGITCKIMEPLEDFVEFTPPTE